MTQSKTHGKKA